MKKARKKYLVHKEPVESRSVIMNGDPKAVKPDDYTEITYAALQQKCADNAGLIPFGRWFVRDFHSTVTNK